MVFMTATESLEVGVLVALIVWLVKSGVGWVLRRRAINEAIMLDIQSRIDSWTTNKNFLDRLMDSDLRTGHLVPYTALFQPSEANLFNALLSEIIVYLPDQFARISKIYTAFREAEDLLSGILRDLTIWKEKAHLLDESDVKYLKAKRDRVGSYVSIFTRKPMTNLSDLPNDYRGIQGTEAITGTIPND
jgi:hypothetical protein